jgi:hypothetical protein
MRRISREKEAKFFTLFKDALPAHGPAYRKHNEGQFPPALGGIVGPGISPQPALLRWQLPYMPVLGGMPRLPRHSPGQRTKQRRRGLPRPGPAVQPLQAGGCIRGGGEKKWRTWTFS